MTLVAVVIVVGAVDFFGGEKMKMVDKLRGQEVVDDDHVVRGFAIHQMDKRYLAKVSLTIFDAGAGGNAITTRSHLIRRKYHKTPDEAVKAAIAYGKNQLSKYLSER